MSEKRQERLRKSQELSNKIQRLGKTMTILITIPMLLAIFLSPTVGIISGVILLIGVIANKKK